MIAGASASTTWFNQQVQADARRFTRSASGARSPPDGDGVGHHRHRSSEPRAVSLSRLGILSAHRPRPVRDQCEGPLRHAGGNDRSGGRASRGHRPQEVSPKDLKIIVSNIGVTPGFSSIYTSNSGRHRLRAGRSERGAQRRAASVHGRVRRRLQRRDAGAQRLFPDRRTGGRRSQPGLAGADRHPGQRHRTWIGLTHGTHIWPARKPRSCPGVSDVLCRRMLITRRCNSTSTACAPANWA